MKRVTYSDMSWINFGINSRLEQCLGLTSDLTHNLSDVLD